MNKVKRTTAEIEALKADWFSDPCWDIEDTEGFEEHKEELQKYHEKCRLTWEYERQEFETKEQREAEEMGLVGLYRMVKILKSQVEYMGEFINMIPRQY